MSYLSADCHAEQKCDPAELAGCLPEAVMISMISAEFTVQDVVGQGSFSVVYKVRIDDSQRSQALKVAQIILFLNRLTSFPR